MWGVVACTNGVHAEAETDILKLKDHPLFEGMLVCHNLTLIDGELCGDPLDAKVRYIFFQFYTIAIVFGMLQTPSYVTDVRKY